MSLIYGTMVKDVSRDYKNQERDLESFLKNNINVYRSKYKLPEGLLVLNLLEVLNENGVDSPYFQGLLKESLEDESEDW